MKKVDLATVGVRLIAIYCYILALQYLHGYVINFVNWNEDDARYLLLTTIVSSLAPGLTMILTGTLLLLLAPRIAKRLAGTTTDDSSLTSWDAGQIQAVLFSAVGLFVCLSEIRPTFENISNLIYRSRAIPFSPSVNPERAIREAWFSLTGGILQIAIGALLFLQARALAGWWHRLRTWNTPHDPGART